MCTDQRRMQDYLVGLLWGDDHESEVCDYRRREHLYTGPELSLGIYNNRIVAMATGVAYADGRTVGRAGTSKAGQTDGQADGLADGPKARNIHSCRSNTLS